MIMEITELMIGDIVQYLDGKKLITVVVVKVDGSGNVVRLKQKNGHKFNTTIDFLRPMPLTPDILEKNGFRVIFDGELHVSYFQDVENFHTEVKVDKIGIYQKLSMLDGLGNRVTIVECKYAHQLQHAFSICKINKQISLP